MKEVTRRMIAEPGMGSGPNQRNLGTGLARPLRLVCLCLGFSLWAGSVYGWNHLTPLTNAVVCPGASVTFSAVASGPTPYRYEWWKNGIVIPGRTNNSLTLTNVTSADAATYSLKLTGGYDSVTNSATLTVRTNVSASSLTNQAVCAGDSAAFATTPSGTGPFVFVWKKNGLTIPGQTNSSLTLASVTASNAGAYTVEINGLCNGVTNSATLTLKTPVGASPLTNLVRCAADSATFATTASGTPPFTYTWRKNGAIVAGATTGSLVLNNLSATDAGAYSVVVIGACGSCLTNSATLTLNTAVAATPLTNQTVCQGSVALFTTVASGTGPFHYQWYQAASALPGQTNSSLTLTNVGVADAATYVVVVSGACGNAVTNGASLTVNRTVTIATPPSDVTACPGAGASFNVTASGTGLSYQWFKSTGALPGRTNSSLTLTNVSAADAGIYSVVVSGPCGNPITNSASLTVNQTVTVATPLNNVTTCPGASASFTVTASGTSLGYQWYQAASALPGRTNSSLILTNVGAADAATYSVVVSGACGNAVTNSASLTLNQTVAVVTPPSDVTTCPGASASFNVTATGAGLGYQWFNASIALPGRTNSSLSLTNVSAADAGAYAVVVSGACGNAVTNAASLTVNQNVTVAKPPSDVTACPGASASFNVTASGTGLGYQWYKAAGALPGQTNASLNLTNVGAADAATYSVVVNGACGNAITNTASLTVNQTVIVAVPPSDVTACPGASASFSISASGTALAYQWYKATIVLPGRTNSSLTLSNVISADAGTYRVVVSGACGNAITNTASLTVNQNVTVATPPSSVTACPGASASFSISASGTALAYQWYKAAIALTGQASSSLSLTNLSAAAAGTYTVVVSGACGNAVTNSANLTVNQTVTVAAPPSDVTTCPGTSASFNVTASGTGLGYQWYKASIALSGRTSSSLTLSNVASADAGTYRVVVSGACGNAITNTASLTVNQNVTVATPPSSVTACPGASASFSISATGTGLAYQWYRATIVLPGQTNSTLSLTNVGPEDAGAYTVEVSGACGNAITNTASLTVNQTVAVVTSPVSVTTCPGASASFDVTATGAGLAYQWYKAATALPGQTNSSLILPNVTAGDAGPYSVVVRGACGNAITNAASLTVNQNVTVPIPPASVTTCPGASPSFNVTASGTGLGYQWYRGPSPLAGQTNRSLTLTDVSGADAGIYSVVVSGACGSPVTNTANLIVNQSVIVAVPPTNATVCPGSAVVFSITASGPGLKFQWFKAADLLVGQNESSLALANVSPADAGTYRVVVSDACGDSSTNSASLIINAIAAVVSPPTSVTACLGATASFNVTASGAGLSYQWYKASNALPSKTGSTLTFSNVAGTDAETYSVVVSDACGGSVTNSASLAVSVATTATRPTGAFVNLGESVTFTTTASGTGPFAYAWKKNGNPISGATSSSLTLANLDYPDAGLYAVDVSGACNTVTQAAALAINHPPTVSIISPTNGTVFFAPANFTVLVDAEDVDGIVARVELFRALLQAITNRLAEFTNLAPRLLARTNVQVGTYSFSGRATDDLGATGTSAPVSITVISNLPITVIGPIQLNYQSGFYEQTVHLVNATSFGLDAAAVLANDLPTGWRVQNASFVTNGVPAILYNLPLASGAGCDLTFKYFLGAGASTNDSPTLVGIPIGQIPNHDVSGTTVPIARALSLHDGSFLINFNSVSNALYYVQYAETLNVWKTCPQPIHGTGYSVQWIDYGPPATDSLPGSRPSRFYRIIRAL